MCAFISIRSQIKRAVATMRRNEAQALENLNTLRQTLRSHLRVQNLLNADTLASTSQETSGRRRRVKGRRARMMRRAAEKREHSHQPEKPKQQQEERATRILEQFVRCSSHGLISKHECAKQELASICA